MLANIRHILGGKQSTLQLQKRVLLQQQPHVTIILERPRYLCSRALDKKPLLNGNIVADEIRLVDSELGKTEITSLTNALKLAKERNLDIIEVVPTAKPPVCHIMRYKDWVFKKLKKQKAVEKSMSTKKMKEITIKDSIGDNDFNVKLTKCVDFLRKGHEVSVVAKGVSPETRIEILERLCDWLVDVGEKVGQVHDSASKRVSESSLTPEQVIMIGRRGVAKILLKPRR